MRFTYEYDMVGGCSACVSADTVRRDGEKDEVGRQTQPYPVIRSSLRVRTNFRFFPCPTQTNVFSRVKQTLPMSTEGREIRPTNVQSRSRFRGWLVSPGACDCEDRRLPRPRDSFRGARPDPQVQKQPSFRDQRARRRGRRDMPTWGQTIFATGKRGSERHEAQWCFERIW
jgi:hypothetical protein